MADLPVSPLAPACFPDMRPVPGVRTGAVAAGLRYQGRLDLAMIQLAPGTACAGVFTQSLCPSAAVDWCREALTVNRGENVRAIVVNAGNANAFTGGAGNKATQECAAATARLLDCDASEVMLASTGVIGEVLGAEPLIRGLEAIQTDDPASWQDCANAIRTTDTFAKGAFATAVIDGEEVSIAGITKGSGMIAPDMATMLGFVFTNANISPAALGDLLRQATNLSYNSITVDSDTSTSDTVLAFATATEVSHDRIESADDPLLADFREKFVALNRDLAQQIVRDGEGATKFVSVTIEGAEDDAAARRIALSVANSPLVKTAIAGEDANWGRIVMAIGKAGEKADRDKLKIWAGETLIADDGAAAPDYVEAPVAEHMKGQEIDLKADVGVGNGSATVWTCDLTHGYISINADYRS